jgi:hypothetical protein
MAKAGSNQYLSAKGEFVFIQGGFLKNCHTFNNQRKEIEKVVDIIKNSILEAASISN